MSTAGGTTIIVRRVESPIYARGIQFSVAVSWLTRLSSKGGRPHSSGTKVSSERRTCSGFKFSVSREESTVSRFSSGTHHYARNGRPTQSLREETIKRMEKGNGRTAHPCTLSTSHHARNHILKHQPAHAHLTLLLSFSQTLSPSSSKAPMSLPSLRAAARNTSGNGDLRRDRTRM